MKVNKWQAGDGSSIVGVYVGAFVAPLRIRTPIHTQLQFDAARAHRDVYTSGRSSFQVHVCFSIASSQGHLGVLPDPNSAGNCSWHLNPGYLVPTGVGITATRKLRILQLLYYHAT